MKFSNDHEWAELSGNMAKIGITDFAQQALGDIVFVELPKPGTKLTFGEAFCSVESVKAVSDLYAPLSGTVVGINEELDSAPELINENPYDNWIVKVEVSDLGEADKLMDKEAYDKFCAQEV